MYYVFCRNGWWYIINHRDCVSDMAELKSNIFKAQRMYYLCIKLGEKVRPCFKRYSMELLDRYIIKAKSVDLKLSDEELLNRIIDMEGE